MKELIAESIILRRRRAHHRYDLEDRIHLKLTESGRTTGVLLKSIYFKCRRSFAMRLSSQETEEIFNPRKQTRPLVLHVYIFGNRITEICIPSPDNEPLFFERPRKFNVLFIACEKYTEINIADKI